MDRKQKSKGEIADVLKIMSFGKISSVNDNKYGNRNMTTEYLTKMRDVHCGWMRLTPNGAIIVDCDIPGRIALSRIDKGD